MAVNAYVNFKGNCREAVEYYAEVFGTEKPKIMTYGDMPEHPDYPMPEEVKNYIMHTRLFLFGGVVMFSDLLPEMPYQQGDNISLALVSEDTEKLKECFQKLKKDGQVEMELMETEWSKCYGSLKDKFGVCWQFNYGNEENC